MKIAIVEDNQQERQQLIRLINAFAEKTNESIEIETFEDGLFIVDHYTPTFDVIYFDVEMPLMDGMKAARKIRKQDKNVLIVFITNFVQWAIEGYAVSASDFLLKPVQTFQFEEHFKRIVKSIQKHSNKTYAIKTNTGLIRLPLNELYYIESQGHYLHFHTNQDDYVTLERMKHVEKELENDGFFRCNNGYLVNLKYVQAIENNIVTVGPHQLQISRPRKKDFLNALTNYLGLEG